MTFWNYLFLFTSLHWRLISAPETWQSKYPLTFFLVFSNNKMRILFSINTPVLYIIQKSVSKMSRWKQFSKFKFKWHLVQIALFTMLSRQTRLSANRSDQLGLIAETNDQINRTKSYDVVSWVPGLMPGPDQADNAFRLHFCLVSNFGDFCMSASCVSVKIKESLFCRCILWLVSSKNVGQKVEHKKYLQIN